MWDHRHLDFTGNAEFTFNLFLGCRGIFQVYDVFGQFFLHVGERIVQFLHLVFGFYFRQLNVEVSCCNQSGRVGKMFQGCQKFLNDLNVDERQQSQPQNNQNNQDIINAVQRSKHLVVGIDYPNRPFA